MISFDTWCILLSLSAMALVLFAGFRRPGWQNLLAWRLVFCSYLVLVLQGIISGAVGHGAWNAETVVCLLSFVSWLWGGVRALVRRSSRYRWLTLTCWGLYLLLGLIGAFA